MSWQIFVAAIGLLFVFEGVMPFLSPRAYKRIMAQMVIQNNRALRVMGLVSMLIGLAIVYGARIFFK